MKHFLTPRGLIERQKIYNNKTSVSLQAAILLESNKYLAFSVVGELWCRSDNRPLLTCSFCRSKWGLGLAM
jgi:hypothetical protein